MLDSTTSPAVLLLLVLLLLVAGLCGSVLRRRRAMRQVEKARQEAFEREFPPGTLDVAAIAPKICRVRKDYVLVARPHPRAGHQRAGLLAAAQRHVAGLSYLRRAREDHEVSNVI